MNRRSHKRGLSQHPSAIRIISYRSPAPTSGPVSSIPSKALSPNVTARRRRPIGHISTLTGLSVPQGYVAVTPDRLTITLPPPPSINHQYATLNGRRILSAEGRVFKQTVTREVLVALARSPHRDAFRRATQDALLSLAIRFFFVSRLRRDVDGGLKIAQDALCEALDINDNRIHEIHLYKGQDSSRPRIEVTLSPLSNSTSNT